MSKQDDRDEHVVSDNRALGRFEIALPGGQLAVAGNRLRDGLLESQLRLPSGSLASTSNPCDERDVAK
jgi:hypothetical protein